LSAEEKDKEVPRNEELDRGDGSGEEMESDEQELLDALMKKIETAGELEEEVDSHFTDFSERVEGVMDSIDRIEKIERSNMEKLLYKDGEDAGSVSEEDQDNDLSLEDQIFLPTESPYEEVGEGGLHPDDEADLVDHYGSEAESILMNLKRLIELKIEKEEMDAANDLYNLAKSMGSGSDLFRKEFRNIMEKLGMEVPIDKEIPDVPDEEKETKVLDPELADGIDILQKKAKNAIEKLNSLIESTDLSQEEFNTVKDRYLTATDLFREKRFHKAHQVSLEGLNTIKLQAQDDLENRIQDTLYKAKGMIEDIEKDGSLEDMTILDGLKGDIDTAMKAFLTNEYERANLLSKKVMNLILDLTQPDDGVIKEKAKNIKIDLDRLKEKNILQDDIAELNSILESAEQLIRRRDNTSAGKVIDQITESLEDVKRRADSFSEAKELEIRLTNRIQRLEGTDHDLEDVKKKLSFLKGYLKDERYEDVLVIGTDLEKELSSLENVKQEMEAKALLEKLEDLMVNVTELEDHEILENSFNSIREAFGAGDLELAMEEGSTLLKELSIRTKTLSVERARRIANGMIEARMLILRLRNLNLDTMDMERRIRKSKNMLKEGSRSEGLKQLDKVIHDMKKTIREHLDYMRTFTTIHRDSLEAIMDRHREQPVIFHIRNKHVPLLRKMEELGRFRIAIDGYRNLSKKFSGLILPEDRKGKIETELTECKFEIYKRKEQGMDISEPLSMYTKAQKNFTSGEIVPAEYLVEISRRYCEEFLPLNL
jgi:hypothetical protein